MVGLTGQSGGTDFGLMLLKDDGANNISIVGTSDVVGNGDETIVTLTEPGNYYWYMVPYATDGTPINFAAAVNNQIDAYEVNDTLAKQRFCRTNLIPLLAIRIVPSIMITTNLPLYVDRM